MDGHRFDALVKTIAARPRTRRGLLGLAAALWASPSAVRPARALDNPPKQIDLIATVIQPSDATLGVDWRIDQAQWASDPVALGSFSPSFLKLLQDQKITGPSALLTLALPGSNGKPKQLVKSFAIACADEAAAKALFTSYAGTLGAGVTPLDAAALLGETSGAFIAKIAKPDDPDFAGLLPGAPAILTAYQEGPFIGSAYVSGKDTTFAAGPSKRLIQRFKTGMTPGFGLANDLAFAGYDIGRPVTTWYSTLGGVPQRSLSADDAAFANQKAQDGDATDVARLTQYFPTTESETFFSMHSWAGRHPSRKSARAWIDGTLARITAQAPTAQIVAINEAQGFGEHSAGYLYTISDQIGTTVGVDLYASQGQNVFAIGLSADSTSLTPGMSALIQAPQPLGKGAQALLGAQLAKPSLPNSGPRPVPLADVFGGSPLQPAIAGQPGGTTAKTTFSACSASSPSCNKPVKQDQTTPYQVWCQASGKCTDAKCTCNLFRTKKKSTTAEWFGKQNEKREYDPDNYTYSCSCGTTTES